MYVANGVTSVINVAGEVNVSLAPNPFHNETVATVNHTAGLKFTAAIYSIDGKLVRDLGEHMDNTLTITRNDLAAGEYMLTVNCGSAKSTLKLMVE